MSRDYLDGPELRAELKELMEANKGLEAEVLDRKWPLVLQDAGYDPQSGEAKAIIKTYDRDAEIEPEAVVEFARTEFGFEPAPAVPDEESQRQLIAQQRADGEARTASLHAGAIPARDPSADEQINQAEANGDWATVDRLNAQKLQRARRNNPVEYGGQ